MTRLFNGDRKTMTTEGQAVNKRVVSAIQPLIKFALENQISLRDLQTMIADEAVWDLAFCTLPQN